MTRKVVSQTTLSTRMMMTMMIMKIQRRMRARREKEIESNSRPKVVKRRRGIIRIITLGLRCLNREKSYSIL